MPAHNTTSHVNHIFKREGLGINKDFSCIRDSCPHARLAYRGAYRVHGRRAARLAAGTRPVGTGRGPTGPPGTTRPSHCHVAHSTEENSESQDHMEWGAVGKAQAVTTIHTNTTHSSIGTHTDTHTHMHTHRHAQAQTHSTMRLLLSL